MTLPAARITALVFAGVFALGSSAVAHTYTVGEIEIGHPSTRATAPSARTGAGYMTLTNIGTEADRLLAAEGEIAERIEIHQTVVTDGVARMQEQTEGLALEPGTTVVLEPGGLHLMMLGLTGPLNEGDDVPLTLTFEQAGEIEIELAVEARGTGGDAHEHHDDHEDHDHDHH